MRWCLCSLLICLVLPFTSVSAFKFVFPKSTWHPQRRRGPSSQKRETRASVALQAKVSENLLSHDNRVWVGGKERNGERRAGSSALTSYRVIETGTVALSDKVVVSPQAKLADPQSFARGCSWDDALAFAARGRQWAAGRMPSVLERVELYIAALRTHVHIDVIRFLEKTLDLPSPETARKLRLELDNMPIIDLLQRLSVLWSRTLGPRVESPREAMNWMADSPHAQAWVATLLQASHNRLQPLVQKVRRAEMEMAEGLVDERRGGNAGPGKRNSEALEELGALIDLGSATFELLGGSIAFGRRFVQKVELRDPAGDGGALMGWEEQLLWLGLVIMRQGHRKEKWTTLRLRSISKFLGSIIPRRNTNRGLLEALSTAACAVLLNDAPSHVKRHGGRVDADAPPPPLIISQLSRAHSPEVTSMIRSLALLENPDTPPARCLFTDEIRDQLASFNFPLEKAMRGEEFSGPFRNSNGQPLHTQRGLRAVAIFACLIPGSIRSDSLTAVGHMFKAIAHVGWVDAQAISMFSVRAVELLDRSEERGTVQREGGISVVRHLVVSIAGVQQRSAANKSSKAGRQKLLDEIKGPAVLHLLLRLAQRTTQICKEELEKGRGLRFVAYGLREISGTIYGLSILNAVTPELHRAAEALFVDFLQRMETQLNRERDSSSAHISVVNDALNVHFALRRWGPTSAPEEEGEGMVVGLMRVLQRPEVLQRLQILGFSRAAQMGLEECPKLDSFWTAIVAETDRRLTELLASKEERPDFFASRSFKELPRIQALVYALATTRRLSMRTAWQAVEIATAAAPRASPGCLSALACAFASGGPAYLPFTEAILKIVVADRKENPHREELYLQSPGVAPEFLFAAAKAGLGSDAPGFAHFRWIFQRSLRSWGIRALNAGLGLWAVVRMEYEGRKQQQQGSTTHGSDGEKTGVEARQGGSKGDEEERGPILRPALKLIVAALNAREEYVSEKMLTAVLWAVGASSAEEVATVEPELLLPFLQEIINRDVDVRDNNLVANAAFAVRKCTSVAEERGGAEAREAWRECETVAAVLACHARVHAVQGNGSTEYKPHRLQTLVLDHFLGEFTWAAGAGRDVLLSDWNRQKLTERARQLELLQPQLRFAEALSLEPLAEAVDPGVHALCVECLRETLGRCSDPWELVNFAWMASRSPYLSSVVLNGLASAFVSSSPTFQQDNLRCLTQAFTEMAVMPVPFAQALFGAATTQVQSQGSGGSGFCADVAAALPLLWLALVIGERKDERKGEEASGSSSDRVGDGGGRGVERGVVFDIRPEGRFRYRRGKQGHATAFPWFERNPETSPVDREKEGEGEGKDAREDPSTSTTGRGDSLSDDENLQRGGKHRLVGAGLRVLWPAGRASPLTYEQLLEGVGVKQLDHLERAFSLFVSCLSQKMYVSLTTELGRSTDFGVDHDGKQVSAPPTLHGAEGARQVIRALVGIDECERLRVETHRLAAASSASSSTSSSSSLPREGHSTAARSAQRGVAATDCATLRRPGGVSASLLKSGALFVTKHLEETASKAKDLHRKPWDCERPSREELVQAMHVWWSHLEEHAEDPEYIQTQERLLRILRAEARAWPLEDKRSLTQVFDKFRERDKRLFGLTDLKVP